MKRLLPMFVLFALSACSSGGENTEPSGSDVSSENSAPLPVTDEERASMLLPGEDPAILDSHDTLEGSVPDYTEPRSDIFFDENGPSFTDLDGNPVDPRLGATDKRFDITAGLGWAHRGVLAFQDGVPGAPAGSDHCKLYGKTCDSKWHTQMAVTSYDDWGDWLEEMHNDGACGSALVDAEFGTDSRWMPCHVPKFNKDLSRTIKWKFYTGGCNQNVTKLAHLRAGIQVAMNTMGTNFGFTTQEVTGGANVQFTCDNLPTLANGTNTLGLFYPTGIAQLEVGAPTLPGGQFPDFVDTCETAGLPGSSPAKSIHYATDFMYSFNNFNVALDDTSIFNVIASCTTNVDLIRRYIGNVAKHEMGHVLGLHHSTWTDSVYGIMRPTFSCSVGTSSSMGFLDLMRNAVQDANYGTPTATSDVYDDDLSCFKPTGY
jgi:hypothetical protein